MMSPPAAQPAPASGVLADDLAGVLIARPRRPLASNDRARFDVGPHGPSRAAVAAVFRPAAPDTELLFIQRATFDGDPWSGQMAFPGGRVEPTDPDSTATAERETAEEIDLDLGPARLLGDLAEVDGGQATNRAVQVSGHCYWLEGPRPELTPNYEVASAVWVPLTYLLDRGRYIEYWYGEAQTSFPGIQLDHPDQVIWGLTLRFLADLFRRLRRPFII